jgi:UDPglucose--hexose-1-phosphate uridylyltransferase
MKWVQLFENKGQAMGCSNPHPHCQIWASSHLPNVAYKKDKTQREYMLKHGKPMLLEYVELEMKAKTRIVVENDHWIAVVPFWALWP